ncbi:hypothetical protein Tco_0196008 [Tanacetum coccineum]
MKIEESLNVTFDETTSPSKTSPLVDDDLDEEEAIKVDKSLDLSISHPAYSSIFRLQGLLAVGDRMGFSESIATAH